MSSATLEPLARNVASHGSTDFERVLNIMGAMLAGAAMDQRSDDIEPGRHASMTIAAAGVAAGYLMGALIVAGTMDDKDMRRVGEMLLTNFRQGVKLGKNQAILSITEGEKAQ